MKFAAGVRRVRRVAKLSAALPFTALYAATNLFRGGPGIRRAARNTRFCSRLLLWALEVEVKVDGPVPEFRGGLVVSNHLGYLDILAHGSILPLRFAAKSDIRCWPLLGGYLSLFRPVWVDRRNRGRSGEAAAELDRTLRNGALPIVYPEGTSSDGLSGVLPFKTTAFEPAVAGNLPVLPLVTRYSDPEAAWYGDAELLPHLARLLGRRRNEIHVAVLPPVFPLPGEDRKALAERCRRMIEHALSAEQPGCCRGGERLSR